MKLSRSILISVLALLLSMPAQEIFAKTYILCLGISDYPKRVNDLPLPVKDAETIKWLFEKNGDCEVVLLTNDKVTKSNVVKQMQKLFAKAQPEDAVALFYSGHGTEYSTLYLYDGNLTYKRICQIFDASKAKRRFAFINACYAGTMRKKFNGEDFSGKNVMFFMSSRSTETTLGDTSMKNSFFVAYLQQGLRGSADVNRDRTITAKELFNYVSEGVKRKTEDKQHPVMWGSFPDNMPIMTW